MKNYNDLIAQLTEACAGLDELPSENEINDMFDLDLIKPVDVDRVDRIMQRAMLIGIHASSRVDKGDYWRLTCTIGAPSRSEHFMVHPTASGYFYSTQAA